MAQGVGNVASGLIGGLPVTQVIVRSSANIQSGGKTKASAFFHGILLLVCAFSIPNVLNMIPYASLAAILLVVGYKLAKPALFKQIFKEGWSQFLPFVITILGIIFLDLLKGIGLGLAVAIVQILWNNFKRPYVVDEHASEQGKPFVIRLSEDLSFLNKAGIMRTFSETPNGSHLIIDGSKVKSMHPDIHEIIQDFVATAPERDIKVEVNDLQPLKVKDPVNLFKELVKEDA